MDYLSLIRPDLKNIKPYVSAASLSQGAKASIILDANENPFTPFGKIGEFCDINRYPTFEEIDLYNRVSQILNVKTKQFYIGRGSSEAIDLLIRLFCCAGKDEILICPPTFSMYEITANVQGAKTIKTPLLKNGQLDLLQIEKDCTDNTKLIFIPTPNAPMGHKMNDKDILKLCDIRKDKSIIIADEAYIELTDNPDGLLPNLKELTDNPDGLLPNLKDYPNLIILRTFSKAYGLAGERLGMAIADADLISLLRSIAGPYAISQSSIKAAMDVLSPVGLSVCNKNINIIKQERERLIKLLPKSPFIKKLFDSVTNFFLVQSNNLEEINIALNKFGIRARPNVCDIENTIRISIGSPEENSILLEALNVKDNSNVKSSRTAKITRKTNETNINLFVDLDKNNNSNIDTGIGFFDHMIDQIATHGNFSISLSCDGDLKTDQHHSIEDCALALGEAIKKALGDKKTIERFGFTSPLDEALATVSIDLSGRAFCKFNGEFPSTIVGEFDTEMVKHFFQSFSNHMIEASFKALGRSLKLAIKETGDSIASTKGSL